MVELEMRMPMPLAKGVPDNETPGWVGLLAMDVTDAARTVYRCVAADGGVYTWVPFAAGGGSGGGIVQESDPTVPEWAKQEEPPFLTQENLQSAVDDALVQAKESGEFKGDKGDTGDTGATGPAGSPGYTPQKGVDYFTAADKAEIAAAAASEVDTSGLVPKTGATMGGALVAQANANYTVPQVRNTIFVADGVSIPVGSNGDVCWFYEV